VTRLLFKEATMYGGFFIVKLLCYRLLCKEATLFEANLLEATLYGGYYIRGFFQPGP